METEKRSAGTEKMSTSENIQDEMSALLKKLADPVAAGESVKACIRRAAVRSGLTYGQTKRIWYREMRDVPARIADAIRERATAHDRLLKQTAFRTLVQLQESDPEFYRECIEGLGEILLRCCPPGGPSGTEH